LQAQSRIAYKKNVYARRRKIRLLDARAMFSFETRERLTLGLVHRFVRDESVSLLEHERIARAKTILREIPRKT
jgi:hypothetical protein